VIEVLLHTQKGCCLANLKIISRHHVRCTILLAHNYEHAQTRTHTHTKTHVRLHAHTHPYAMLSLLQALILPVIHRGLRDRTGDTKKKAARIAGNMASLVNDAKVMSPAHACTQV
jgi:hypothetical protein